jgi:hypothetical protein
VPIRSPVDAVAAAANASADEGRCLPDLSTQPDGTPIHPPRGLREAVDDFAARHGRQVQVSYRETTLPSALPLFFTTWAVRA